MKISLIGTTNRNYGGNAYENMIAEVLSKEFDVKFISTGVKIKNKFKYLEAPFVLWRIFKTSRKKEFDVVIRNFTTSLCLNKKPVKNIAIIHHIDNSTQFFIIGIIRFFLEKIIFCNIKKCDIVVTVSKCWENYFKQKGYKNIYRIYNAFNLDDFKFTIEEIELLKKKYNLTEKPIVYIGNCQKAKGVLESYNILKDLDVHLVTSGKRRIKISARNLELNYRDYLLLLRSSSVVVAMSKFKEGWNRTVHEAMLCKTPVIGSGTGGMRTHSQTHLSTFIKRHIRSHAKIIKKYSSNWRSQKFLLASFFPPKIYVQLSNFKNFIMNKIKLFLNPEIKKDMKLIKETLRIEGIKI